MNTATRIRERKEQNHLPLTKTASALTPFSSSGSSMSRRQNRKIVSRGHDGLEGSVETTVVEGCVTLKTTSSKAYFRN